MDTSKLKDTPPPGMPFNPEMMGAMAQLHCAMLDAVVNFQREAIGFAEKRLNADLKLQRDLVAVRDVTQFSRLQQEWLAATLADYSAQAARLIELVKRTTEEETQSWAEAQTSLSKVMTNQAEAFTPSIAAE